MGWLNQFKTTPKPAAFMGLEQPKEQLKCGDFNVDVLQMFRTAVRP
jgi:hypothetical protein